MQNYHKDDKRGCKTNTEMQNDREKQANYQMSKDILSVEWSEGIFVHKNLLSHNIVCS